MCSLPSIRSVVLRPSTVRPWSMASKTLRGALYSAAFPLTKSTSSRISTMSPGTPTSRLIYRTPSTGDVKVMTSPRCGSPSFATAMSVSGILKSYASRLTRTTSPSSRVGRMEPDGMGFQSAMAERKNPKQSKKIRNPRFCLIQRFIGAFRWWWVIQRWT